MSVIFYTLYGWLRMKLIMAFILIAIICFAEITNGADTNLPFSPGEKLTFQAKWSFIPAGEIVLEVLPVETLNGIKVFHFVMTMKSYEFVDVFYKVRDQIEAYTDTGMTHSLLYRKKKEGKRKKDVVVTFDWEKGETQYSNFGEKLKPVSIRPGSFDPLSVFYAFRLHDLKENREIERVVTDGKKCVVGKARIIKREEIKVPGGTYDTFLVEPDMEHIGGVFKKSKNARLQVWFTADKRRIPVKIRTKVAVGSFVGELISVEMGHHNITDSKNTSQ